jgi:hypothetical protein
VQEEAIVLAASRTELQFLSGDRPGYEAKFAKDRCTSQSCAFAREGEKAVVQVIQAKRWVTVIVWVNGERVRAAERVTPAIKRIVVDRSRASSSCSAMSPA